MKIVRLSALTAAQVHAELKAKAPRWYARWSQNPMALQVAADLIAYLQQAAPTANPGTGVPGQPATNRGGASGLGSAKF